jgi:hypothetical protein
MAASSPETPFDYAIAARSVASSSGDEGAKRKASRSSGDEGCSSPAKRSRPDAHGQDAATAVEVEVSSIITLPILCGFHGAIVSLFLAHVLSLMCLNLGS